MNKKEGFSTLRFIIIPVLAGILWIWFILFQAGRVIPRIDKAQKGYVIPNKLQISLTDLDNNNECELVLEYLGIKYLLTLDEKGKPKLREFKVKASEIVLE